MKVELNSQERLILLDALIHDGYVKKTLGAPDRVKNLYENLKKKMTTKEVEATKGKPVHAIELLRKEMNFITFKFAEMNKKEKDAASDVIIDLDRARAYLEDL